jgi:protein required for attachment to host cells
MRGTVFLVANANRARLYHVAFDRLTLLEEAEHSAGHDRPRAVSTPDASSADRAQDVFAQELAGLLHEYVRDQPVDVVIAAPTRFLARIAARLDDTVESRVTARVPRDYTGIGEPALTEILRTLGVRGLRAAAPA